MMLSHTSFITTMFGILVIGILVIVKTLGLPKEGGYEFLCGKNAASTIYKNFYSTIIIIGIRCIKSSWCSTEKCLSIRNRNKDHATEFLILLLIVLYSFLSNVLLL